MTVTSRERRKAHGLPTFGAARTWHGSTRCPFLGRRFDARPSGQRLCCKVTAAGHQGQECQDQGKHKASQMPHRWPSGVQWLSGAKLTFAGRAARGCPTSRIA